MGGVSRPQFHNHDLVGEPGRLFVCVGDGVQGLCTPGLFVSRLHSGRSYAPPLLLLGMDLFPLSLRLSRPVPLQFLAGCSASRPFINKGIKYKI